MHASDPLNSLAAAYYAALSHDLPYVSSGPIGAFRRPSADQVEVTMFRQEWPSTALGFDGVGGRAMTKAYTTVVCLGDMCCVYFAGRLAYRASKRSEAFSQDLAAQKLVSAREAGTKYALDHGDEVDEDESEAV